jgi:hypothetical protein
MYTGVNHAGVDIISGFTTSEKCEQASIVVSNAFKSAGNKFTRVKYECVEITR